MTYYICPMMTGNQRQVILGTVLGGSSIVKPKKGRNCYLSMRGGNPEWLQCKAQELSFLLPPNPFFGERKDYYRWHSKCSPLLNDLYDLFYPNNKKTIRMEILDELRDIGLSVWFLDSGTIKNSQVIIKTKSEADIISKYFSEVGLQNDIVKNSVVLNKISSMKFLNIIHPFVPQFMKSIMI